MVRNQMSRRPHRFGAEESVGQEYFFSCRSSGLTKRFQGGGFLLR